MFVVVRIDIDCIFNASKHVERLQSLIGSVQNARNVSLLQVFSKRCHVTAIYIILSLPFDYCGLMADRITTPKASKMPPASPLMTTRRRGRERRNNNTERNLRSR